MMIEIYTGDILEVLRDFDNDTYNAVLTDPPYGLNFMNKTWDKGVPPPEVWSEIMRVCRPGSVLMAFGGTRTWHRLGVSIEDAGWEIFDTVMWVHSMGFPKSQDLERTTGNSAWEGYGTQLKPSWEPLIVARKPRTKTFAEHALEDASGALNIDECRVPLNGEESIRGGLNSKNWTGSAGDAWDRPWRRYDEARLRAVERSNQKQEKAEKLGRWPANFVWDGSKEIYDEFAKYGVSKSVRNIRRRGGTSAGNTVTLNVYKIHEDAPGGYDDEGTVSRFFYAAKASTKERNEGLPPGYKNEHPTVKPISLTSYFARMLVPPVEYRDDASILVPFSGVGSEMIGAMLSGWVNVHGIEIDEEYVKIASQRLKYWSEKD